MDEDRSYLIENARNRLNAEQEENERRRNSADERVRAGNMNKPELIPATVRSGSMQTDKLLRVAAYCRVSTDAVEQETSYELQKDHFEKMIRMHPNWRMAGIYADKGKSGTNTKHRDSFLKLIEDCYAGKIDLVVTRAVSRFARNLLDCLNYVRELKKIGVEVYFEQENLKTLDGTSEMILTVLSMVAQEESHIKSEAMNSSVEIRFGLGMFLTPALIGYDHIGPGELQMNYSESLTVRKMYYMLLNGYTPTEIAEELMRLQRPTKIGRYKWTSGRVVDVLKNERYCGDVLARKTYTFDYLTHKSVPNRGERNQYYKADHHEAIVTREQWNAAQKILRSIRYQHSGAFIPITVIERGILQGFISINRTWAGHQLDEYFDACRSAMPEVQDDGSIAADEGCLSETETDIGSMISAEEQPDRYQVVKHELFSRVNEPVMRIKKRDMVFNDSCIRMLTGDGDIPQTVEMLLNPVRRMLALRACAPDHPNAIPWIGKNGKPRKLGCTQFSAMLYSLLELDDEMLYHFQARLNKNAAERILFFELKYYEGRITSIARKLRKSREEESREETDTMDPEDTPLTDTDGFVEVKSVPDYSTGGCFGDYYDIHQQCSREELVGCEGINDPGHALSGTCHIPDDIMRKLDEEIIAVSIAEEQLRQEKEPPRSITEDEAHRALGEEHGI